MPLFSKQRIKKAKQKCRQNFHPVLGLFSIKITLFGRQKRHPREKDGVFSEENEVFRVEKTKS